MITNEAATQADYLETLAQVVQSLRGMGDRPPKRPPAAQVVDALLQAEKATKHKHTTYTLAQLVGTWRLVFVAPRSARQKAGVSQGRGWYVPAAIPAQIAFAADAADATMGAIANQIRLGGIQLRLTGPLKYPGKKNLLGFDFTQAEFSLFGRPLYRGSFASGKRNGVPFDQQSLGKLPFFAFFVVTDDLIAARGRGGGLAIWLRVGD